MKFKLLIITVLSIEAIVAISGCRKFATGAQTEIIRQPTPTKGDDPAFLPVKGQPNPATDPDVATYLNLIESHLSTLGATGQIGLYPDLIDGDTTTFNQTAGTYFQQQLASIDDAAIGQLGATIAARYDIANSSESARSDFFESAFETISPVQSIRSLHTEGVTDQCHETLLIKQARCDRDMVVATAMTYTIAGGALIASGGTAAPGVLTGWGIGMLYNFIKHSICIDDSIKDYQLCKKYHK